MNIEYGKTIETTVIDEEGSFIVNEIVIVKGEPADQRVQIEKRFRVSTEQEELTSYLQFRDQTRHLRDAAFRIEHKGNANRTGDYYVIWCYSIKPNEPIK